MPRGLDPLHAVGDAGEGADGTNDVAGAGANFGGVLNDEAKGKA